MSEREETSKKDIVPYGDKSGVSEKEASPKSDLNRVNSSSMERAKSGSVNKRAVLLVCTSLVLVLSVIGLVFLSDVDTQVDVRSSWCPGSVPTEVAKICDLSISSEKVPAALAALLSEKPLSFASFASELLTLPAESPARTVVFSTYQKGLLDAGFSNSATVVMPLVTSGRADDAKTKELFRNILASGLPESDSVSRIKALKGVEKTNAQIALQLSLALYVDKGSSEIGSLIKDMLLEVTGDQSIETAPAVLAVLVDKNLARMFSPVVVEALAGASDEEILWAFKRASTQEPAVLAEIAKQVLSRGLVSGFRSVFLSTVVKTDPFTTPPEVYSTLIKGAEGGLTLADVTVFGRWLSIESEEVLLAVAATNGDNQVGVKALEILGGRTLRAEPGKSMVEWARANHWSKRNELAEAIGMLGLVERASDEQFSQSMERVLSFAGSAQLLSAALESENDRLVAAMVHGVGALVPSNKLLSLLTHSSEDVRVATVIALKDRNNLDVLKKLNRAYEKEENEAVRKVYEEHHWVVRDR